MADQATDYLVLEFDPFEGDFGMPGDTVFTNRMAIARAIESEVRKQDEALIRQLVEALTECKDSTQERIDSLTASGMDKHKPLAFNSYVQDLERAGKAITAARARLEDKP